MLEVTADDVPVHHSLNPLERPASVGRGAQNQRSNRQYLVAPAPARRVGFLELALRLGGFLFKLDGLFRDGRLRVLRIQPGNPLGRPERGAGLGAGYVSFCNRLGRGIQDGQLHAGTARPGYRPNDARRLGFP